MRFAYESMFCLLVLASLIIYKVFILGSTISLSNIAKYQELWDLLKFITPILIGIPILTGGTGFITAFYQNEPEVIKYQLYRHILMAVYFEIGAFAFIFLPIIKKIIEIRLKL